LGGPLQTSSSTASGPSQLKSNIEQTSSSSTSRRDRVWLSVSLCALLFGWLSPGYAGKCWGRSLGTFLNDAPISAALVAQSGFVVLLVLPRSSDTEEAGSPGKPTSFCALSECCTLKAFKFALPLGLFLLFIHTAWYASLPRTSVAINTVVWNSDTVTTPLIAALLAMQHPSWNTLLGGFTGLAGVCLSVGTGQVGNTNVGCMLCLTASVGYGFNAVIVENIQKKHPDAFSIVQLLALEGFVALILLVFAAGGAAAFAPEHFALNFAELPPFPWLILLAFSCLCLNVGWLWCAEIAGATWTALAACLSIPFSIVLDLFLLGLEPDLNAIIGAALVLLGFALVSLLGELSSQPRGLQDEPSCKCCLRRSGSGSGRWSPLGSWSPLQKPLLAVQGAEEPSDAEQLPI